ncbi:MAG TPA: VIT domain-containing protein, partial [Polyangia bacterium]
MTSHSVRSIALFAALFLPGAAGAQGKVLVKVAAPIEAPLSLTASDGAGLELVSLSARAVIEDPLAFTELHLVFRNPEQRVREGRFRITLPEGATVSRFAMLVNGRWQEGEVVELQAARRAYEDFLHRRQDPALLETEAGNEFSARVFPIPAGATKELILSYSQELTGRYQSYLLPLRGLPKMRGLSIRALVGKTDVSAATSSLGGRVARHEVIEVDKRDFAPDRDFEVAVDHSRLGLRTENLVVARVAPLGLTPADSKLQNLASLLVLFDTSASRALGFAEQVAKLNALIAELAKHGDP